MSQLEPEKAKQLVFDAWESSIIPALVDYIRIPNKSPAFDPSWAEHGHMEQAVGVVREWCEAQPIAGLSVEVVELPERTPVLYLEVPATDGAGEDCVLLYGHLDKQPEMEGWRQGLGPWIPFREGDRLYGRGGADDGYAVFASLTALRVLRSQGIAHARCVILIEACEESGSFDLPFYIDALSERIGSPSLVICLDSGCGNYDQMWCTTSLRGLIGGTLRIATLSEGVHSGDASGIVPDTFRVLRSIIGRIEEARTGEIDAAFQVEIPSARRTQAVRAAEVLGEMTYRKFPFTASAEPAGKDHTELVLNRTWRPALAVTGADGLPGLADAGNVLRPATAVKLSLRIPPTLDAAAASRALKERLEEQPPYGAEVEFTADPPATGWNAPALSPWLESAAERASQAFFERGAVYMGEGGAIPFMGMLGEKFPQAQFLVTGVLGPQSNAHGPNEFLHVPTGKRLTCAVAHVIGEHRQRA